ncbi:N-acetyltransferase [Rhizocola hellebori]|uniref:N-acetyltransferase n=1 Tax=Rhizocola hellebori TaxID=1392758 RepID=A0A8J3Q8R8_9ACTN|nr:GNAT family N-acetyltransferase [Rhizocola hellebori]GIH05985.1 N-acetyltransferase [Rhizocola hellebori]
MALGFVRPARQSDAAEIARVQLATWRTAYRRLLPRHILEEIDEDFLRERWLEAIVAPPSERHRVLVAIEQAAQEYLVGFLASEPAEEDHGVAAITELLVEPRWGRRGHGSRLLAASVDLWRADGFTAAGAWAFDQDIATQKFLTSAGWAPDGSTRALDVDDLLVPQNHLHVSLEQIPETDGETGTLDD